MSTTDSTADSTTDNTTETTTSSARSAIPARLRSLQHLIRRHHAESRGARGPLVDTSRGRGRVLAALQMQSPIPTRELAFLLDIRQQSLNELLKKLESDGLVERTPSDSDKRVMLVGLTAAGRAVKVGADRDGHEFLDALTDEEAAQLVALLDKLIDALETELGADSEEDLDAWMAEARRRMGDERFESMLRMREAGFGPGPFGPGPRGPRRGFGPHDRGDGHHGGGRGHRPGWKDDGGTAFPEERRFRGGRGRGRLDAESFGPRRGRRGQGPDWAC